VVTKDQLLDEVWQRRFVSESSLKSCMNELRKALADDVKAPLARRLEKCYEYDDRFHGQHSRGTAWKRFQRGRYSQVVE
jgi:hypothetical protein